MWMPTFLGRVCREPRSLEEGWRRVSCMWKRECVLLEGMFMSQFGLSLVIV